MLSSTLFAQQEALQVHWEPYSATGSVFGVTLNSNWSWAQAKAQVAASGLSLATLDSPALLSWFTSWAQPLSIGNSVYCGLRQSASAASASEGWQWSNGSAWAGFPAWQAGSPLDPGLDLGGVQNAAEIRLLGQELNDIPESNFYSQRAALGPHLVASDSWSWPIYSSGWFSDDPRIVTGDMNGDGLSDLIREDIFAGNFSLYFSSGSGTFQPGPPLPYGASPTPIDMDADGDLDLAMIAGGTPGTIRIFANGTGGLDLNNPLDVATGSFQSLAAGDFTGDSLQDLVALDTGTVSLLEALPGGTWTAPSVAFNGVGNPGVPTVADLDQDGDLDLVTTWPGWNRMVVAINNGTGLLTVTSDCGTGAPVCFASNLDNDPELEIVTSTGTALEVWDATGTGAYVLTSTKACFGTLGGLADMDGDGLCDAVVGGETQWSPGQKAAIYFGNGSAEFTHAETFAGGGQWATPCNLNGDGAPDLLAVDGSGSSVSLRYPSNDCDGDGLPDRHERDCDGDGIPDSCEILEDVNLDQNLNGILDSCEASGLVFVRHPETGRLYTAIPADTWIGARAFGTANSLFQATVEDEALGTWLRQVFDLPHYWIGYHDAAVEGQFQWSSGSQASYENWGPGAPGDLAPDQDFTAVEGLTGLWETFFASTAYPAIMESMTVDCDGNGVLDDQDIALDPALDFNGDGLLDSCQAPNYCTGGINSSGSSGVLGVTGTPVIAANDIVLTASSLPTAQWSYFLMSQSQANLPGFGGSQGVLCLGSPQFRFNRSGLGEIAQTSATGTRSLALDLGNLPQGVAFQPGETWNFQLWFRDLNPGLTSNTTDGIGVMFR